MNTPQPQILTQPIDDTLIQYLYYEGNGPNLVLLHATGFLPWLWHPLARDLCRSFRVFAPYFCDHRYADPEKGGLGWKILAQDLKQFCDRQNLDNIYCVGHSMGGTVITLAHTLFNLDAAGIILIEPIFLPEIAYRIPMGVSDHPLASKSIKRKNHWNDPSEALEYLKSKPLFKTWDEEMLKLYIDHGLKNSDKGGLELTCSPQREASLFMGGSQYDPWPELPKIKCPTLIVEGQTSGNKKFIDLKKAAADIPEGRYTSIPDAGHLIPMEKPKIMLAEIQSFFDAISSTQPRE